MHIMNRDWLQLVGTVLVVLGVGVWMIYGVGRYFMGWDVTDRQFLPYHLACVIPGMLLWRHRFLRVFVERWRLGKD